MFNKDFIFSVARIRALESRLLNAGQVERMASAPTAREAFKIFNDLDWATVLGEADKPEEFQEVLDAGLLETKDLINSAVDYENDFDFLWFLFDLHNAKLLTKALVRDETVESVREFLSVLGSVSRGTMERIVFEKEAVMGLEWLLPLIAAIKADFSKNGDPEAVEIALEKAFLERIMPLVKSSGSHLIKSFFGRLVDIKNILAFLRRGGTGEQETPALAFFLPGGKVPLTLFAEAKTPENLAARLPSDPFGNLGVILRTHLENGRVKSWLNLEKDLDEFLFETLKPSKMEAEGPEAVFAFFWQKQRNAEIVRAIMVGKLNELPEKEIRSWLKTPSLAL